MTKCRLILAWLAAAVAAPALAAVDAEQAQRLKSDLTPVGAERAGNAAGTIPAWTGGLVAPAAPGTRRPDPFAGEAPLFTLDARNFRRYGDLLPEGAKALFAAYPDFRMRVFPSHRSAAAPARVYDNIFRNATHAYAVPEGIAYGVQGAIGGVPFPIPANGTEIVWNHLLSFWGTARDLHSSTYVAAGDGTVERIAAEHEITDFPYYYPGATVGNFDGYYFKTRHVTEAPPAHVGEAYVDWQPIDTAQNKYVAWRYLPGEHRVRKAPSLSYDTPDPDASGLQALDEYYLFFGGPDRYDFKNLGKREMLIPYNNNAMYLRPDRDVIGPRHENPDALRYERHRVWVVDGTLAAGKHHVVPHRRLYVDEDTWLVVYADSWNENGRLWKFGHSTMYDMPEIPAVIGGTQFVYDLLLGGYCADLVFNDQAAPYQVTAAHPAEMFDPQAMAADAVR